MRKITEEAVNAFYNGNYFKSGNTIVDIKPIPHGRYELVMKLHNNPIAISNNGELTISSCGWLTTTTKERLNGILSKVGAKISQVKGVWFVDCKKGNTRMFHDGMTFKL